MMRGHFLGFASIFIMGSSINMLYPIINNEITEKLCKVIGLSKYKEVIKKQIVDEINYLPTSSQIDAVIKFYNKLYVQGIINIIEDNKKLKIVHNISFSEEFKSSYIGVNKIDFFWWGFNFYLDESIVKGISIGGIINGGFQTIVAALSKVLLGSAAVAPALPIIAAALLIQGSIMAEVSNGCGTGATMSYFLPGILVNYWAQPC